MNCLEGRMRHHEVICIGESMALFVPAEAGPVHEVRNWTLTAGGAESNVACHLAGLGLRSRWVSALGDDAFGRTVLDSVGPAGVDVTAVEVDPSRPTGLYVKEANAAGSPVRYYRQGSAASAMAPDLLDRLDLDRVELIHISGITAALSADCLALSRAVLKLPIRVSFDLNWRPALGQDPVVLRELADTADIVFVGDDEAEAVWGTGDPRAIRGLLPSPEAVVVKHGSRGATLLTEHETVFEPALKVEVVEPVGAGDAFAAGFLAGTLAGEPPAKRLRRGHLVAAGVLLTVEDIGQPLPPDVIAELLDADAATWGDAHVTGGGAWVP
jgi:2-dehydro-3-deoxygluconokinase